MDIQRRKRLTEQLRNGSENEILVESNLDNSNVSNLSGKIHPSIKLSESAKRFNNSPDCYKIDEDYISNSKFTAESSHDR
jgi:hypothetical protein